MRDWRDDSSIINHVRERYRTRYRRAGCWITTDFVEQQEPAALCGGELTEYDLALSDVIRAGKLVRRGEVLVDWCRCEECARMVRELAGENKEGS